MKPILMLAPLFLATAALAADDVIVVDNFDYADASAAQKAWAQREGLPPAEVVDRADGKALKIPCPFATIDTDRNYVDRQVQLDFSAVNEISITMRVSNPKVATHCTLYFRSGDGWYGKSIYLSEKWKTVILSKASFNIEDKPAGWQQIDGIRLSPWRSQKLDGYCLVDNLVACSRDIVVVAGTAAVAAGHPEARGVTQYADAIVDMLRDAGVAVGSIGDLDIEHSALDKAKVAILAYSPVLTKPEIEGLRSFVGNGGKIIVFYTLYPEIADILGIRKTGWMKREAPGDFAAIRFDTAGVPGLPEQVPQHSWNFNVAEPVAKNAKVIGRWLDSDGKDIGKPAVLMSDTGVFMSHILLPEGKTLKQQMLLAWLGRYVPEVWETAVRAAIASVGKVGPIEGIDALEQFVSAKADRFPKAEQAKAAFAKTRKQLAKARALADQGQDVKAIQTAHAAADFAAQAYRLCHRPRACEFRAVWNHSGTGAYPGDWEKSMKNLAEGGFNMVVPNMWWAGYARYKSEYLPLSAAYKKYGDQIAACVAAAKKYGIEVHPWKVNWNLSGAPKDFVDKMRAEGRTQVDVNGKPVDWLCPSNPANFELELNTMVEVAKNYDVDGVHFDYIRYPNGNTCFCDGCRKRFEEKIGRKVENWPADVLANGPLHEQWVDFRCAQISRLVKATSERVHAIKPYCRVSAAVFNNYPNCRESVGQDWVEWCRKGWLDFVCPMNYIDKDEAFATRVSIQMGQIAGSVPFCSGIGATLRWAHTAEQAISQIEIARNAGADGFIIFNYGPFLADNCVPQLGEALLSEPATLPSNAPRVEFKVLGEQVQETHFRQVRSNAAEVVAVVQSLGAHRKKATGIRAQLRLEDTTGRVLAVYGGVTKVGQTVTASIPRRDGKLRAAVAGELTFDDGSAQSFVARSYPFEFAK